MNDTILMFEGKPLTRREVLIAREAFLAGADVYCNAIGRGDSDIVRRRAERQYPLPKIKRPRVVKLPDYDHFEFRIHNEFLEERSLRETRPVWRPANGWGLSKSVVCTFADLFANPTELVDDDGSEQP